MIPLKRTTMWHSSYVGASVVAPAAAPPSSFPCNYSLSPWHVLQTSLAVYTAIFVVYIALFIAVETIDPCEEGSFLIRDKCSHARVRL